MAVTVAGAVCSVTGRERGWDLLNLGGPGIARMAGYLLLAFWARSAALLLVVLVIATVTVVVVTFARGNTAISLQLMGFSAAMLFAAAVNQAKARVVVTE
jgi:hypothetical protein